MNKKNTYFLLLIVLSFCAVPASWADGWSPDGLLVRPLTAAIFEPRVGSMVQFGEEKLRLDIGTSLDVYEVETGEFTRLRFGADFMTYTRLRSEGNFKFPVETSDYYFGINSSFKKIGPMVDLGLRLRFAHISSHLVDGLADASGTFVQSKPFVYSREFIDILGFSDHKGGTMAGFRFYAGVQILYAKQPRDFGLLSPQIGFDYSRPLTDDIHLLFGYDFRLPTIAGVATGVNAAQVGIKFGERFGKGISLNWYGYAGKSVHGMFYGQRDQYSALGFQVNI